MKKKIGIIGSGMVAQTLANGFLKEEYPVMVGSRKPEKLEDWKAKSNGLGKIGTFDAAAAFGDILVLAVSGRHAKDALQLCKKQDLANKCIMDATNPISDKGPKDGMLNFFTDQNYSLMEHLQEKFPEAHFVKAFNSVGSALMVHPKFSGGRPSMFICGNNAHAKKECEDILIKFGWDVEDMGTAVAARAIEPLCMLWCIPGFKNNKWNHAFKLLKA